MAKTISVLCVHGVGHGDADPDLQGGWTSAIHDGLVAWNPALDGAVTCDFLLYDSLFEKAPQNPVAYAKAFAGLLESGVVHGIGDLFTRDRGLFDIPETLRWTAGMTAQWVSDEQLRADARDSVLAKLKAGSYDVVCAHSLGSLICYDAFIRNPAAVKDMYFVSFGSQIGNPFVRDIFAGRIVALPQATTWFHLFNPDDHVLTADIRLSAENFEEIGTKFDIPNDVLNHSAIWYLGHQNTRATVWRNISGAKVARTLARGGKEYRSLSVKPTRRALLIGINDYPDPANRLEGCVNDVFLMSAVLQECGLAAEDIRIVLNERATAASILDRLKWLLDGIKAGDERVLFYSGHGAQMPVYGPSDEVDHMDECLVPYDFDWTPQHAVTDKQFAELYSQIPYDAYFAAIFDCCHAGGMTREGGRRVRGLTPPDDIRHRALRWNPSLQVWEDRPLPSPNPSLTDSRQGVDFLGSDGATYRMGRAIRLRTLPQKTYDSVRSKLKHHGPYLPVLMEACQESQLSYEYRDGAQSYGAFTFCLAASLRAARAKNKNPTFTQLMDDVSTRLAVMKYDQTPNLLGAKDILGSKVPWTRPASPPRGKRKP
ncbi:caspase family protein [Cupriavidus sp. 2TAF22]|uniref:caspase family protein n=1 Tax=unclassified Cupriavidus TaxID=2640874 RepID=UPI003F92104C